MQQLKTGNKTKFSEVQRVQFRHNTSREKTTCGYRSEIFAIISKHSLRKFCHSVRHYTNINVSINI